MSAKQRSLASRKSVINEDGEVPDLTLLSRKDFKPFSSLPKSVKAIIRGRPKAEVTKERITIRLSPDVVAAFRASGAGWQTRIDAALKDWLKKHRPI
jgi:uncharacterized protein (DUF4415 family)